MSTLRVNTLQNTSGVEVYTAKAWVNFNGTGTVAIRASGNVSSITDNGAGDYTINFTVAMVDTNYAVLSGWQDALGGGWVSKVLGSAQGASTLMTTTAVRIGWGGNNSSADNSVMSVSIFR